MTVAEASKMVNLSPQLIRVWIQNGNCPFGYIVRKGEDRNTYLISEALLKKWIEGTIK